MSVAPPKVLLTVLWQRTSARGNEYLSGYLGKARIIGFRGEPTADGTPTWHLYLQPGKEQEERAGHGQGQQPPSTSAGAATVAQPRPPRTVERRPKAEEPGEPFFADDISDVGGPR